MELGNLLFGNSRGQFKLPDRDIVSSDEWANLKEKVNINFYGIPNDESDFYGFDNDAFTIRPYYWGEDGNMAELPNFLYKPTGFKIHWYKYPFRDSYMNQDLNREEILKIFDKCIHSI